MWEYENVKKVEEVEEVEEVRGGGGDASVCEARLQMLVGSAGG